MYDPATTKQNSDFDSIIEAFEHEGEVAGCADVVAFLPDESDPVYERVAVELVRIDLERSWARGGKKRLDTYREIVPALFSDSKLLGEIAYEEYRLRRQAGERVNSADYHGRYGVDTSAWPDGDGDFAGEYNSSTLTGNGNVSGTIARRFPQVGQQFAGFELIEQLGRGAFGVVFRARQSDLAARDVVVKVTAARSIEPQRLARLQHTNIVPIYSMHLDQDLLGICMPYFGARTLSDVMLRKGIEFIAADESTLADRQGATFPADSSKLNTAGVVDSCVKVSGEGHATIGEKDAIELVAQLAEGLGHAHQRGIVHSDLKPANVLITDHGTPMILDFNLSSDSCETQYATLLVGGTLPYMAPEHLLATLHGGQVLAASDVFSLGAIFFELVTGERPFADPAGLLEDNADELLAQRGRGIEFRTAALQISPGVQSIIRRCLAPNLDARYSCGSELAEDLRRHQQDLPLRHAVNTSIRERGQKWLRRNARGVRLSAAAILLAAVAGLATLYAVRQNRILDLEAATEFASFKSDVLAANLNLHAPGSEPELKVLGQVAARRALLRFNFLPGAKANEGKYLSRLPIPQQTEAKHDGVQLLYSLAEQPLIDKTGTDRANNQRVKDAIRNNELALGIAASNLDRAELLNQRRALLKAGGMDAATDTNLQQARQINSDEQENYFRALSALERGNFNAALEQWEHLSSVDPQDPIRWLLLGNAYVGVGRLRDAEACYTALIALQPKASAGYFYRALCRAEQGFYSSAEKDYTAAIEIRPTAAARINRALVYYATRDFKAAERDATAAMESGVVDPRAYFVRALIRNSLGDAAGAREDRERGLSITPLDDKGWVARGMSLLSDDAEHAAREFELGAKEFPRSKPLLQNLIHIYGDRLNRFDLARAVADRFVELYPIDMSGVASRAVLRARTGDVAGAKRDAEQLASSKPSPLMSLQLACVYSLLAEKDAASSFTSLQHLRQSLAKEPKLAVRAALDPDLTPIRSTPEYRALIGAAERLLGQPGDTPAAPADSKGNKEPGAGGTDS